MAEQASTQTGPQGNRAWWKPAPAPELSPITPKRAYGEVLFVYLAFFVSGIINAALILGGRSSDFPTNQSWGAYMSFAVDLLGQIGLAVAVVYLLGMRRGVTPADLGTKLPRLPNGDLAVSRIIRIMAWGFFALIIGAILNEALQSGHLPTQPVNAPATIFGVFDALQAGIIEELVVLAFVVVSLRQARRPLWEITVVALVLRGAYHIYYGPGVFGILLWAALFYWIYLRTRALIPLMVCHFAWDSVAFVSQASSVVGVVAVLCVGAILIVAPILWLIERSDKPAQVYWATSPNQAWPPSGPIWPPGPSAVPPAQPSWPAASSAPPTAVPSWPAALPAPVDAADLGLPAPVPPAGSSLPPPGWHPDPGGSNRWRWWDGYRWTDFVSQH